MIPGAVKHSRYAYYSRNYLKSPLMVISTVTFVLKRLHPSRISRISMMVISKYIRLPQFGQQFKTVRLVREILQKYLKCISSSSYSRTYGFLNLHSIVVISFHFIKTI